MNKTQARDYIKQNVKCTDYLQPAPNHSAGHNTGFICPACGSGTHSGEKSTGAAEYYPATNTFYCHSCKAGGDVINLYRYITGESYTDVLQELAKAAGIEIESTPESSQKYITNSGSAPEIQDAPAGKTESGEKAPADYIDYYIKCADRLEAPEAVAYLKSRGISLQTARRFILGYDPAADPAAAPGAIADVNKKHPEPRIIAPCTNDFYIARAIDPETPRQYKAINPAGSSTQLFNEGAIYGIKDINCFVVEGLFDALAIEEHGAEAVALSSCSNGNLLIDKLQERPAPGKIFIICFDRDANPDTRAKVEHKADDLAKRLKKAGYKAITFNICGRGGDPNEAATRDPEAFKNAIAAAKQAAKRDELNDFLDAVTAPTYKPIKTEIPFFDELTGGVLAQTLTVLMAAPGAGKTMLAQQIAESMATNGAAKIIYLNFEMSREQLLARAISARLHKSKAHDRTALYILQGYKWSEAARREILAELDNYRRESLPNISYNPAECSPDLDSIKEYLQQLAEMARVKGEPAPAVFVDYLQLINCANIQDVKEIYKAALIALKDYAKNNNTFCFLICAVNRESARNNIDLFSARDTSSIEYNADTVLSLDNYKQENAAEPEHTRRQTMVIKVLKSRLTPANSYSIVYRDGSNNIFSGQYTGKAWKPEPEPAPEWTQDDPDDLEEMDDDSEQLIF